MLSLHEVGELEVVGHLEVVQGEGHDAAGGAHGHAVQFRAHSDDYDFVDLGKRADGLFVLLSASKANEQLDIDAETKRIFFWPTLYSTN